MRNMHNGMETTGKDNTFYVVSYAYKQKTHAITQVLLRYLSEHTHTHSEVQIRLTESLLKYVALLFSSDACFLVQRVLIFYLYYEG